MKRISSIGINALQLKILAMIFMVMDHVWATLPVQGDWLTCVGRLAFPIFAFQIAEGYAHTHDVKAYRRRLLIWALITEIPFNFMTGGGFINPFHQNVLFTFWLSLLLLGPIERAVKRGGGVGGLISLGWTLLGFLLGTITMVDYFGYGILMVILFYISRNAPAEKLLQLIAMYWINFRMMGGLVYPIELLGREFLFPQQGFALLALIPIWLYNGQQGPYNKTIRRACYAFYPAHIAALAVLAQFVFR